MFVSEMSVTSKAAVSCAAVREYLDNRITLKGHAAVVVRLEPENS